MQFPADFTAREQALLGPRFAELYAYATPQPARGVTVNGLRCTPEWFAAHADFAAALKSVGLPAGLADMLADSDVGASKGGLFDDSHTLSKLIGRATTSLAESVKAIL